LVFPLPQAAGHDGHREREAVSHKRPAQRVVNVAPGSRDRNAPQPVAVREALVALAVDHLQLPEAPAQHRDDEKGQHEKYPAPALQGGIIPLLHGPAPLPGLLWLACFAAAATPAASGFQCTYASAPTPAARPTGPAPNEQAPRECRCTAP